MGGEAEFMGVTEASVEMDVDLGVVSGLQRVSSDSNDPDRFMVLYSGFL